MQFVKKLWDDIRTWAISHVMDAIAFGLIAVFGVIGKAIWNSIKSQPVPWAVLLTIGALGLSLAGGALGIWIRNKKNHGLKQPLDGSQFATSRTDDYELTRAEEFFHQIWKAGEQQEKHRREVFLCIVDCYKKNLGGLKALQVCKADELETNDELVKLCDELVKYDHPHPFAYLNTIPQPEWLEFIKDARLRGVDLGDETELLDLSIKKSPYFKQLPSGKIDSSGKTTENEIRDSICRKINELIRDGDELLHRLQIAGVDYGIEAQFDRWSQRCEEYLRTSLGEIAVRFFHSPAKVMYNPIGGSSAIFSHQENPHRHRYERIASCVMRLHEIIKKVETGEFEPC